MRDIYIVRHGEPEFPGGKWLCIGSGTDLPLSAKGREQAAALRPFIDSLGPAEVWSSPMVRTRQTAELMTGGLVPVHIHPGLREFDLGLWEGLILEDVQREYPDTWRERMAGDALTPPGGEHLALAGQRFEDAVRDILARTHGTVVIAAHMGVTSSFLCRVTNTDCHRWHEFQHDYGTVTKVTFDGEAFGMEYFGKNN